MWRTSKIVPILLLASACALAAQSVPFELHKGYVIVVKCSAANTPDLTAIIDTGVTETVIDLGLARRLNLTMRSDSATFVNGEGSAWAVSIPSLQLGPLQADALDGIAVDLSGLRASFGVYPDLLIGMDLLRHSNFTIDYQSRLLTFGPVPHLAHVASLVENSRLALIESIVLGRRTNLQLDTGINGLVLYADRFRPAKSSRDVGAHLVGVSRTTRVQSADVDFQLGNWREEHVAASFVENGSAVSEFDGLLGARSFAKHRLAFDFEKMVVAWE